MKSDLKSGTTITHCVSVHIYQNSLCDLQIFPKNWNTALSNIVFLGPSTKKSIFTDHIHLDVDDRVLASNCNSAVVDHHGLE